ncbi:MAG: hypothetical protein E3J67_04115 [Dehalococcoidia bacterium]|nr:MAG: hypothetical protein E3J67_04115 [Dehalococcoidia bacterium]
MIRRIATELKEHIPFTAFGAITGIIILVIIVLTNLSASVSENIFYTLHPLHVVLSAIVTTAMYRKYGHQKIWKAILIGYGGSIGIATISDAFIPYLGGALLNLEMEFEVPFIKEWWLVNPLALVGIAIGYFRPTTKFPHFGHVLLSTWASLFYFTAFGIANWIPLLHFIFIFLFLAVWLPCCVSDIVFPLLFTRKVAPSRGDKI